MKKNLLLIAMMMVSAFAAANDVVVAPTTETGSAVTLPIYTDEVISTPPAGTVVSDVVRKGYSYYYTNGSLNGGYNDSFAGEYVLGDDGNIYIKTPCASVAINTYLKLEPVEGSDDQYVMHTAQLVYVDYTSTTPYPYFCTRLVHHKYSEYSYGYVVEESNGQAVTDVFFTYKDGVLKQNCTETIDMNGEIFPKELLGFTNSTGGWIGYGDACLEFVPLTMTPTTLPEGAEVKEMSFVFGDFSSKSGDMVRDARLNKCAEVGDAFYLACPLNENMWIKGDIDRTAGTVTFQKQYLGINENVGVHQWFIPAYYSFWFDLIDEEENYGYWKRNLNMAESYVCKYENGCLISDKSLKQVMTISQKETEVEAAGAYMDVVIKPYEPKSVTPSKPIITSYSPFNGMWAEVTFALDLADEDDVYVSRDELYYTLYLGSEQPYALDADTYFDCTIPGETEIPAYYSDDIDFWNNNNCFHFLNFYEDYPYFGIQAIHKYNGEVKRSEIAWYNHSSDALVQVEAPAERNLEGKHLENGQLVIVKNGQKYNANGAIFK